MATRGHRGGLAVSVPGAVRLLDATGHDPILVETDEGVRPGTTAESLGGLRPAFDKEGTVTAAGFNGPYGNQITITNPFMQNGQKVKLIIDEDRLLTLLGEEG